jgi:CubicO group peptidase (beta-lactamase class C family)
MDGFVASGYEGVAAAFERNFTERGEVGAAFAAHHAGRTVVDLWGGVADRSTGRAWQRDTLQLVFSGTKGLAAACVLLLVERGRLDLDAPVARYWPEFGQAGKAAITVAEVLSHQCRLPGVRPPVTTAELLDHDVMAALLAAQAPSDDPRAEFTYHALTYGWLADELVRRVDGRSVGALFHQEFAAPLDLELWIGLPDELHHRAATTVAGPGLLAAGEPTDDYGRLVRNPLVVRGAPDIWNGAAFRRAGLAAVGAHGTARSIARFYAGLACDGAWGDVRLLAPETVRLGRRVLRRGTDSAAGTPMAYGAGFELFTELGLLGPATDVFGHAGAGGSRHGAWPADRVGFSYAMNEIRAEFPDRRPLSLLAALHDAVRRADT